MTEPTISIDEFRALMRQAIEHAARFVPRSRRAEFLAGLEAELETMFADIAARRRRSQLRALVDGRRASPSR